MSRPWWFPFFVSVQFPEIELNSIGTTVSLLLSSELSRSVARVLPLSCPSRTKKFRDHKDDSYDKDDHIETRLNVLRDAMAKVITTISPRENDPHLSLTANKWTYDVHFGWLWKHSWMFSPTGLHTGATFLCNIHQRLARDCSPWKYHSALCRRRIANFRKSHCRC